MAMLEGGLSPRRLCVAPMLDHTDRHFRYLLRLITRRALLYTEMVASGAVIHGEPERHLGHHVSERPLALQLGGSAPDELAQCAAVARDWGFAELNLNVGCPSERVQAGRFGACLMAEPDLVAACVAAMRSAGGLPVTVKTRIGIDRQDDYGFLYRFVESLAQAGVDAVIVHARKAWLKGLSPRENRRIPPLDYPRVSRLKADFPELEIILNGGIRDPESGLEHLARVDGVMLGRAVMDDPYSLARVDTLYYGESTTPLSPHEVLSRYLDYAREQRDRGVPLTRLVRPLTGLFQGQPGARLWRRTLSGIGSVDGDVLARLDRVARVVGPREEMADVS